MSLYKWHNDFSLLRHQWYPHTWHLEFRLAQLTSWTQIVRFQPKKIVGEDPAKPQNAKAYQQSFFHPFLCTPEISWNLIMREVQPPGTLHCDSPQTHLASDCCLKFFSGQGAFVVLVMLLQVVNHCLGMAPPVFENTSPRMRLTAHISCHQLSGLNFLEILYELILRDAALCKGGKSAKSIQSQNPRQEFALRKTTATSSTLTRDLP